MVVFMVLLIGGIFTLFNINEEEIDIENIEKKEYRTFGNEDIYEILKPALEGRGIDINQNRLNELRVEDFFRTERLETKPCNNNDFCVEFEFNLTNPINQRLNYNNIIETSLLRVNNENVEIKYLVREYVNNSKLELFYTYEENGFNPNGSINYRAIENNIYVINEGYGWIQTENPFTNLNYNETKKIKVQAYFQPIIGEQRIDWRIIGKVNEREFDPEWIWMGINWKSKRSILIQSNTNASISEAVLNISIDTANIISDGGMRTDCGDIRITNNETEAIEWWNVTACNTGNTQIYFNYSVNPYSKITYTLYYNNSEATYTPFYRTDTMNTSFDDDFSDGNVDDWSDIVYGGQCLTEYGWLVKSGYACNTNGTYWGDYIKFDINASTSGHSKDMHHFQFFHYNYTTKYDFTIRNFEGGGGADNMAFLTCGYGNMNDYILSSTKYNWITTTGTWYSVKIQFKDGLIDFKIWDRDGEAEPNWDMENVIDTCSGNEPNQRFGHIRMLETDGGRMAIDNIIMKTNYPLNITTYSLGNEEVYSVEYPLSQITLDNLILNSTEGTNNTDEDLYLSFIPKTNNTDTPLYANISFFNSSIHHLTFNNIELTNGSYYELMFNSSNTTIGNIWYAVINITNIEGRVNFTSNNVTIANDPPTVPNMNYPEDNVFTVNYSINLSCSGSTDLEGDYINYEFYVDKDTNPPTTLKQNLTETSYNYDLGGNGYYYWRCRANDNKSVSGYTPSRLINLSRILIDSSSQNYENVVYETSLQDFILNLTYNGLLVGDINSTFTYNNTPYTTTKTDEGSQRISFESSLIVPSVETHGLVKNFNWNLSISYLNGTLNYNNSIGNTQNINQLTLTNCTNENITLIMKVYDEKNPNIPLVSTIELESEYWVQNSGTSNKFQVKLENSSSYNLCLSVNKTVYTDTYIRYTTENGFTHRYYLVNESLSNVTKTISMFNFNTTTGISDLKITVRNKETYDFFENIVTKLQRRYLQEGIWRTVQMDKTGDFGLNFFNIIEESIDYRLLFSDINNNLLKTSDQMKFICSSGLCELTFLLDPSIDGSVAQQLIYDLSYDNVTGIITLTWNDNVGATSLMRLHVTKETMTGTTEICNPSSSGSSGTLTCDASAYTGEVYVRVFDSASPEEPTATTWIKLVTSQLGNLITPKDSAFWAAGIMVTIVGFGIIISPVAAVITTILGLITLLFLGLFTPLTITFVMIASILGIVIGVKMRR
jgi:hypothetical protein